ncbi:unnamed protein product [Musa acuminata subsp. malaccensis]|uniref:(wild Malaysian banana) hypothetical protein n=1 Tax=Musa acuminata subsp. malaccensis TaxID=214687 RepID=A0A804J6I2_MUSAM|nr:unnamed protein product [Musa acuminata subsp. malaccensis]
MSQRSSVPYSSSRAIALHSHLLVSSEINPNPNWL